MVAYKVYYTNIFKSHKQQIVSKEEADDYVSLVKFYGHNLINNGRRYGIITFRISIFVLKNVTFLNSNVTTFINALTQFHERKMKKRERKMVEVQTLKFNRYNLKNGYSNLILEISYPASYFYRNYNGCRWYNHYNFEGVMSYINHERENFLKFISNILENKLKPFYGNNEVNTAISFIDETPYWRFKQL
jgi:hypothetical protein